MYHRLVKTTPKPSATKKSNGELLELESPPPPGVGDGEAVAMVVSTTDMGGRCVAAQEQPNEFDRRRRSVGQENEQTDQRTNM